VGRDKTAEPHRPRTRLGVGAAIVLVLGAFAVTVVIGMVRTASVPIETFPTTQPVGTAPATAGELYVHVSGAVSAPGLYVLSDGARVVDAVAAAGGFADDADRGGVNLARPVGDGEQLRVPRVGEASSGSGATGQADGRVNLNTADEAALDTLPRVGPALARRIIEWREANGAFASVEDLRDVPGFGDKMVDALRDLVTV
jgi:competence protein ComEA